jgi:hypothetical protein
VRSPSLLAAPTDLVTPPVVKMIFHVPSGVTLVPEVISP